MKTLEEKIKKQKDQEFTTFIAKWIIDPILIASTIIGTTYLAFNSSKQNQNLLPSHYSDTEKNKDYLNPMPTEPFNPIYRKMNSPHDI